MCIRVLDMPARKRGITAEQNFWDRIEIRGPDECWPHKNATVKGGYVQVRFGERRVYAHRLAYELAVGPIPDDHEVDHTCHGEDAACVDGDECQHRRCCNPAHLEPVTASINSLRAHNPNSAKTHCPQGHDYARHGAVSSGRRHCKICNRDRARARRRGL